MAKLIKPPYFDSVVNDGEKRLLDFLLVHLSDEYILIPNIEIASTNPRNNRTQYWEYDVVVVAPHAIFNIENKDWKGRIEGDDNYWYLNDRQKNNPLKTGRQKTAILNSKLKEHNTSWGKAWIQNMVTLSYPNTFAPSLWQEAGRLTFQLNESLISFLTNPDNIGKSGNEIKYLQKPIVEFLIGNQSKKKPDQKKEVEGYEIVEILTQESNYVEYLVKPKGVTSSIQKRVKEFALQINGLSKEALKEREDIIKNQYNALHKLKAKPFILNVEFKIDEENHLFYEISDFLDENSLRAEARQKTFTFTEKINIIRNILSALKEAHKVNIYHRDINPDNIYLSGGYAYLGNFGKSYFTDHNEQGYTVMATINESNATPYHPLELTVGDASRASDIYSVGVLIYWLFTEKEPFKTPYDLDKMGGRLLKNLLPSAVNSVLPKWLDELCNKTILVDDSKRSDSIEELESFILNAIKEESSIVISSKVSKEEVVNSELKVGDRVGVYTIYEVLGQGGYSKVFKVKHRIQDQYFALKLFHESVNISSVRDEYTALKELNHPNIVKFIWNDEAPNTGQFFTVMEFLHGENLSIYTRTEARLPIYRIFQVGKDILSALIEMQSREKPILHRDIKPQNIIWDGEKRFVLIDFNVASFAEDNKDFVGTNPYLAPDIISDNYKVNWDLSADVFALGITLYELVCKQYPWSPGRLPLISKAPNNPKDIEPKISLQFSNFLLKAISTNKDERFKNAYEMHKALENIGVENLLSNEQLNQEIKTNNDEEDIVGFINSLYSQSKHGNTGTRASFQTSNLERITYTPTKLDKRLIPAILDGQYKLVIITGNAGDGKTAFIKRIEENSKVEVIEKFSHKNGARFKINGFNFESNYDGSQDEAGKVNNEVLEEFFNPFADLKNYNSAPEGRIIAINEGRLVEFLTTSQKYKHLAEVIEEYFYKEGHANLPEGVMIINLNLRSVVAEEENESSLFKKQVKALTNKDLWKKCQGCSISNKCFIKYNVDSFNDSASGESVVSRLEWLLRTTSLKRELHITMRDLRSFLAYSITRDYKCSEVESLLQNSEFTSIEYWKNFYFNLTDPTIDDTGNNDRLIKLLRETDIGNVSIPNLDRDLFFDKHQEKNYLEFSERKLSLLEEFNKNKIIQPAFDQGPLEIDNIKAIQKLFIRHQYFEGKAELLPVLEGEMPSYLKRLPYNSVFKFVQVLRSGEESNLTKKSISRAISLNEGCDNLNIDSENLVLASTEVKDVLSKSFRLFPLNDFELLVNSTNHLVNYLEYEPDSLIFRHKNEKHIRLTISLDLYEMLFFIQQGFSPSLNDLRGKFIELIIFKNLLENLEYNTVVVTRDNNEFYSIRKDDANKLHIESLTL
jgi:serine/threonine protein kinase